MKRRQILARGLLGVGSIIAFGLSSACRQREPITRQAGQAPAPTRSPLSREVTIGLGTEPRLEDAPLLRLAASESLARQGTTLSFVRGQNGFDALPNLVAERAQFALLDFPTVAQGVDQDLDLVAVYALYRADPSSVLVRRGGPIAQIRDLVGARIAVRSLHATETIALNAALRGAGLDRGDVSLVVSAEPIAAFERGEVAAVAASGNLVPWIESRSTNVLRLNGGGWQLVPGPALVALRSFVSVERELTASLVSALRETVRGAIEQPDSLQQARLALQPLAPTVSRWPTGAVESIAEMLRPERLEQPLGALDPGRLEAAASLLRDLGVIRRGTDFATVYVTDFLPRSG